MSTEYPVPQAIDRRDDAVTITWSPEHVAVWPSRALRLACPCASCRDEMTGRPLLDPSAVPAEVTPRKLQLVGGYAIRVDWSDGHGTGIYTFEQLLAHCPCERCSGV